MLKSAWTRYKFSLEEAMPDMTALEASRRISSFIANVSPGASVYREDKLMIDESRVTNDGSLRELRFSHVSMNVGTCRMGHTAAISSRGGMGPTQVADGEVGSNQSEKHQLPFIILLSFAPVYQFHRAHCCELIPE